MNILKVPKDPSMGTPANRTLKVARYSFSGSIPPKFEHKLRRHKQSFGKIATTVVLEEDQNLFLSGLQRHRSCHSNVRNDAIPYFTCSGISRHWELFFENHSRELFRPIAASMFVKFKRNL